MKAIVGKLGFDTHSYGLQTLGYALERLGHKVVYLGRSNNEKDIVQAAVDEDVDAVFLQFYHLDHFGWVRAVKEEFEESGREDISIVVGGIIPDDDQVVLEEHGIIVFDRVTDDMVEFIEDLEETI